MRSILAPGARVLYMKVGRHADEPLEQILERKRREIAEAGFSLWGYGGNTCHPLTMVQPFARSCENAGGRIYLCMHRMQSNHFGVTERAHEYSTDGQSWHAVHPAIHVTGSRYALAIRDLREEEFRLPLSRTRVAVGNSTGVVGAKYISGRVDKACLEILDPVADDSDVREPEIIGLVAELVAPYAVFVRNLPTQKEHVVHPISNE